MIEEKELMSPKEVARYLGVHKNTVYRYLKNGLPSFYISERVQRIKVKDLENWIKEHRKNGEKEEKNE